MWGRPRRGILCGIHRCAFGCRPVGVSFPVIVTDLSGREELLDSITVQEKELAAKIGENIAMVTFSI